MGPATGGGLTTASGLGSGRASLPPGAALHEADELEARYRAYRRRQAMRLLQLMPRDAIRPLHRQALAAAASGEGEARGDDPLDFLAAFCERVLPLPPMEVWRRDLLQHPDAHLEDLRESVHGPTADAPATLDSRELASASGRWRVFLRAFRDGEAWRGFMVFRPAAPGASFRTAAVFREADPLEIRERFRSFDPGALEAFLRSARP